MALVGPDTRLRMIAIKQQSGIPLNDKEVKRLARRQSVEAMYARNGWNSNGGMQGAYNDASGHFQARSMANSIGRIQGEYGENAVAGVQKYNREDLIDRDRLNKANIEGKLLDNQHQRFINDHQEGVYNQGVAEHEARMKSEEALYDNRLLTNQRAKLGLAKEKNAYELDNNVRRERLNILKKVQEDKKNYDNTPLYLRNPNYKLYSFEQAKADAIASGDEARYLAAKGILDERRKIALDSQSAQSKADYTKARIDRMKAQTVNDAKKNETAEAKVKAETPEAKAEYISNMLKKADEYEKMGDTETARLLRSHVENEYGKKNKKEAGSNLASIYGNFGDSSGNTFPMNKKGKGEGTQAGSGAQAGGSPWFKQ